MQQRLLLPLCLLLVCLDTPPFIVDLTHLLKDSTVDGLDGLNPPDRSSVLRVSYHPQPQKLLQNIPSDSQSVPQNIQRATVWSKPSPPGTPKISIRYPCLTMSETFCVTLFEDFRCLAKGRRFRVNHHPLDILRDPLLPWPKSSELCPDINSISVQPARL